MQRATGVKGEVAKTSGVRFPSRREVLALGAGAFVVAAIPLTRRRARLVRRTIPIMGTLAELAVVHRDLRHAHASLDVAAGELLRVERLMSRFSETSDVGRVNRRAAQEGVLVSPETAHVLEAGLDWAARTAGAFDPSVGSVIELWDVTHRLEPPAPAAVRRLAARGFFRSVDLGPFRGGTAVRFQDPDARIDLG